MRILERLLLILRRRIAVPVADFSADDTAPDVGQTVTLAYTGTGTPLSYSVDWGDGAINTVLTHAYTAPGTYTVALTVRTAGGQNTKTRTNYLVASFNPNLVAHLSLWLEPRVSGASQDSAGTTPATVATDPVGKLPNLYDAANPWSQATAANRGTLAAWSGGLAGTAIGFSSSDYLQSLANIVIPASTTFTLYASVKVVTILEMFARVGNSNGYFIARYSDGNAYLGFDSGLFQSHAFTVTGEMMVRLRRAADNKIYMAATGVTEFQVGTNSGALTWSAIGGNPGNSQYSDGSLIRTVALYIGADIPTSDEDSDNLIQDYFKTNDGYDVRPAAPTSPSSLTFARATNQPSFPSTRLSVVGRPTALTGSALSAGSATLGSTPVAAFVNAKAAVTASTGGSAYVGLRNSGGTVYLAAKYDLPNLKIAIVAKNGGAETEIGSYTLGGALSAGAVLEFTLCGRCAVVHVDGTFYLARFVEGTIEIRTPSILSTTAWGMWASGASVTFGDLSHGYFQGIGITDFKLVKTISGDTYQDGSGNVYFTADAMAYGAHPHSADVTSIDNWSGVHGSVWQFHPVTGVLTEIGKLFPTFANATYTTGSTITAPPGGAGARPNVSDFCLRYDPNTADFEWIALGPVGELTTQYVMFYGRLASMRGIQTPAVIDALPFGDTYLNFEFWTVSGTYNAVGSKAFAITGGPTLWRGPSLAGLTQRDRDNGVGYTEGASMFRMSNTKYVLFVLTGPDYAPSGDALGSDLGMPTWASDAAFSQAAPWPTIFEYRRNGKTEFRSLRFDNSTLPQPVITKDVALADGDYLAYVQAGFPVSFLAHEKLATVQTPVVDYGI